MRLGATGIVAATIVLVALVGACGAADQAAPAPTVAYLAPTATATATPTPTQTPTPTPTPIPPTATPIPPTRAPERVTAQSYGPRLSVAEAVEQWRDLVSEYDWPVEQALVVIDCESDGDAYAVNPSSGACGLMQIHPCGGRIEPGANVAAGYAKWRNAGGSFWQDWGQFGGCGF